jgi:hypothetical protein
LKYSFVTLKYFLYLCEAAYLLIQNFYKQYNMGAGIGGVIPLIFHLSKDSWEKNDSSKKSMGNFVDFYDEVKEKDSVYYCIKDVLLLDNFKDFYFRFHTLIDTEDNVKNTDLFNAKYDEIVATKNSDAFVEFFSKNYNYGPRCMDGAFFSSSDEIICDRILTFYNGSYKAILEEYSTLYHMRKLLAKALDNPLAKVANFGMLG